MDISTINEALDLEFRKLQIAKAALTSSTITKTSKKLGRPVKATSLSGGSSSPKKKRKLSSAGRASIVAAQKARWAKLKKA